MSNYLSSKRAKETILVAKDNAALPTGGSALQTTTGDSNLADGQIGVFHSDTHLALSAGDTVADAPKFYIAQGTGQSVSNQTVYNQIWPYLRSGDIIGKNIEVYRGQSYTAPALEAWAIGGDTAANAINLTDGNNYQIRLAFKGRRQEELVGTNAFQALTVGFKADFGSITGSTDAAKRDYIVQNLVDKINKHSRLTSNPRGNLPIIAFAIDSAATTATSGASTITGITAGTTAINGYTITADMETAFDAIADDSDMADIDSSSRITPVDLDTAGDGSTATTDAIVVLSLENLRVSSDENTDRMPQTAVRIDLALGGDFSSNVAAVNSQDAFEGEGEAAEWKIRWRNEMAQQFFGSNRIDPPFPQVVDPFAANATYDAYYIRHSSVRQIDPANVSVDPKAVIILVPSGDTATTAALEAVLNPYMASVDKDPVNL